MYDKENTPPKAQSMSLKQNAINLIELLEANHDALIRGFKEKHQTEEEPTLLAIIAAHDDINFRVRFREVRAVLQQLNAHNALQEYKDLFNRLEAFLRKEMTQIDLSGGSIKKELNEIKEQANTLPIEKKPAKVANLQLKSSRDEAVQISSKKVDKEEVPIETIQVDKIPVSTPTISEKKEVAKEEPVKPVESAPPAPLLKEVVAEKRQRPEIDALVKLVRQEMNRLHDARGFFSIGIEKKLIALTVGLVNAQKALKEGKFDSLSGKDLCEAFLSHKEGDQNSLAQALHIHRISPTRANGNSLFFNQPADSWKKIDDYLSKLPAEHLRLK